MNFVNLLQATRLTFKLAHSVCFGLRAAGDEPLFVCVHRDAFAAVVPGFARAPVCVRHCCACRVVHIRVARVGVSDVNVQSLEWPTSYSKRKWHRKFL